MLGKQYELSRITSTLALVWWRKIRLQSSKRLLHNENSLLLVFLFPWKLKRLQRLHYRVQRSASPQLHPLRISGSKVHLYKHATVVRVVLQCILQYFVNGSRILQDLCILYSRLYSALCDCAFCSTTSTAEWVNIWDVISIRISCKLTAN